MSRKELFEGVPVAAAEPLEQVKCGFGFAGRRDDRGIAADFLGRLLPEDRQFQRILAHQDCSSGSEVAASLAVLCPEFLRASLLDTSGDQQNR